jgi:hypothetical protein
MLHTKRDAFNLAKLARFMSVLTIAMVLLPPAVHGQSMKDKCGNAVNRDSYMETQLKNGKVLIAGGFDLRTAGGHVIGYNPDPVGKAEICDPSTGKLSPTGSMIVPRCCASATLLQNGQVLIAGGGTFTFMKSFNSAEVYDPATGAFTAVGAMTVGRSGHTATLLDNGRVLIAGGSQDSRGALTYAYSGVVQSGHELLRADGKYAPIPRVSHGDTDFRGQSSDRGWVHAGRPCGYE